MFNFKQLPPPPAYVNNLCTTKGYRRFFKLFYVDCHGDLSPCNNDSESGRSMVEMLGVLAIIGVLTVGGVAGFNYAMDKHNANEILDNVSKRAIALSPMALQGLDINSHALDTEFGTAVGAFPVALDPDQTGFDIIVSKVPRGVCDHVLSGGLKMAEAILLGQDTIWEQGEKSDHTCAETDNEIVFAFNASLDGTQTAGGGNNVGPGNPGGACELGGQAGVETTVYLCDENAQGKCCKVAATTVCVPTGGDTSGLILTDETNCPATTHKCTGDMKCVCQETCTGGRTQNPADCSCTCPADKPNWNESTETCEMAPSVSCPSDSTATTDGKCQWCVGTLCITCDVTERMARNAVLVGKLTCYDPETQNADCAPFMCKVCDKPHEVKCGGSGCVCYDPTTQNAMCNNEHCQVCDKPNEVKWSQYDLLCYNPEIEDVACIRQGCLRCPKPNNRVKCGPKKCICYNPETEAAECGSYECIKCERSSATPSCTNTGINTTTCSCVTE